ncbi:hypothetical protein BGZ49_004147 [Haplosporangium sp. Z 27]|nr:hypothetical protein BGZ49_004147 [Haplosporangium sp. Z 27]
MNMMSESSLHSFIITGEPDLEPFSLDDGLLIKEYLKESDLAYIDIRLSSWKKAELLQYQLGRDEVIALLKKGLDNLLPSEDSAIDKNEFDTSRTCVFSSLFDTWQVYRSQNYKIPLTKNESWYRSILWGFLWKLFALDQPLTFEPGEKSSSASSNRKNHSRTDLNIRHLQGSKVDGIISCEITLCELCVIEAGAVDSGPNSTKTLSDRMKLAKTLKDMYGAILEKCKNPEECQKKITTFGILISGLQVEFASLRYLEGHFFRYQIESKMNFPSVWYDHRSTSNILSLIAKLFIFKERMLEMSNNIITWSQYHDASDFGTM